MKTSITKFKGKHLKELLKQNGLSQEEFSEIIDVSPQTVSYWITGKRIPSSKKVEFISNYFNVPIICFTHGYPLMTKEEYDENCKKLTNEIQAQYKALLKPDVGLGVCFAYLNHLGKKYKTFDFEQLDKGVVGDLAVTQLIRSLVEQYIEELFLEFDVIKTREVFDDDEN